MRANVAASPAVVLRAAMRCCLWAVCASAAWPGATLAAPDARGAPASPAAVAKAQYRLATQLFGSGAYDEARAAIDEGLASSPRDLPLLGLKGSLLMAMHDLPGALAAYQAYLAAGATGAKKRQVEEIVKDLLPVLTTSLDITVVNGPAQIYIPAITKAVFCTAAPSCPRTPMLPRAYQVVAERPGFERWTGRVTVANGESATLAITLVEQPSALTVRAAPPGAAVTVDDAPYDAAARLAPGPHVVVVSAPGQAPARREVMAHAGQPIELDVTLAPAAPATAAPAPPAVQVVAAPAPPRRSAGRRVAALVTGGAAVVAGAVGVVLGLQARQLDRETYALCASPSTPCGVADAANDRNQQARTRAIEANVAFGVAGGAAIAAAVIWFTGARESRVAVTPSLGARAGVDLSVRF